MNKIIFIDKGPRLQTRQTRAQGAPGVVRTERATQPVRSQLVCRWRVDPGTGRLSCAWSSQESEEQGSRRLRASRDQAANANAVLRAA